MRRISEQLILSSKNVILYYALDSYMHGKSQAAIDSRTSSFKYIQQIFITHFIKAKFKQLIAILAARTLSHHSTAVADFSSAVL